MNKKFLSAILFGALMVTSTGTFVSCKDYDDDIENLQGQISANSSAIAELKALLGDGNYVTSISVSGNSLVVNTKNGSANVALPECEDEVGSICTVSEEGELLIDGKATGIKVAEGTTEDGEFLPAVKIVDGEWAVLQEDGTYKSTGVAVSSVAVTGDKQNGYVLTVKDAEGTATVIELPTAASLITSIEVVGDVEDGEVDEFATLMVKTAVFTKPNDWAGKRELPSTNSRVYGVSSLDVRIDPVSAPAQDVDFYLTNTVNHTLSNLKLYAAATLGDNALTTDNIHGRAAVTGNGLWTLKMDQFVLAKDDAEDFEEDLADNTGSVVYAVNANKVARSNYNVVVASEEAEALTTVKVVNMASSDAEIDADEPTAITVNVGQTYKIDEIATEDGLMWDMYFSAEEAKAVETYGLEFDHLNRTFTVTKRPDVVTTDMYFILNVNTLDISGNLGTAQYKVSLSAKLENATAIYPEVVYDLSRINDGNDNNDFFSLPISTMKTALGNNWTTWANSVELTNTKYEVYTNANVSDGYVDEITASTTTGLKAQLRKSNGVTSDVNDLNNVRFIVDDADVATYTVDTQYYIKVTFYTEGDHDQKTTKYINHIVVPVKFTAPTVADQFALKSGYVVNGVVNAFYYNYEEKSKEVDLIHYFDKVDEEANVTLDTQTTLATLSDGTALKSAHLAVLGDQVVDSDNKITTYSKIDGSLYLNEDYDMGDDTGRELGYGKELVVNATNATYDGWKYKTDAQKAYSFKIKLMSPIFEGTIRPVDASTIKVTANAEEGFAITKDMIELADYNKNLYCVVPDAAGDPTDDDVWSAAQIDKVEVDKDDNNTYIKTLKIREFIAATEDAEGQEGAIMVYADPLPNTQATSIDVIVTDCWGYVKAQEVSVTIVKK